MLPFIMAGVAALGSLNANAQNNKNLFKSQLAIVGGQKSANVQTLDNMRETHRATGTALTQVEREELKTQTKLISSKSRSNLSGNSAVYAVTNIMQQGEFTKGTVLAKSETDLINEAKKSQARHNQAQSNINELESKKKDSTTMLFEAAMAGFSAYSAGVGLESTLAVGSVAKVNSFVPLPRNYHSMLMRTL